MEFPSFSMESWSASICQNWGIEKECSQATSTVVQLFYSHKSLNLESQKIILGIEHEGSLQTLSQRKTAYWW